MHDLLAPLGPLFPAPCGTAGRANVTAVNAPQAMIELSFQPQLDLQCLNEGEQQPLVPPVVEAVIHRLPRWILVRQVAPRRTSAKNPKDTVEHRATIRGRAAGVRSNREPVLNPLPLLIRE